MEKTREFYAFISYKREDEKWAKWLQDKLEHYKFPTNLNGRTDLPKEIRPTFRDVTNLEPGLLEERIDAALHNSQWLIVVCSPRSAQSPWVCKEAQSFIDQGRSDRIIPFVIEGTPFSNDIATECYPDALRSLTGSQELLAANINEMGRDAAVIKVVACMFGLRFDTLWQRHERQKRRRRNWIIAAVTAFVLAVLGVAGYILHLNNQLSIEKREALAAKRNAEEQRDRADSEKTRAEHAEDSIRYQYNIIEQTNADLKMTIDAKSLAQSRAAAKVCESIIKDGNSILAMKIATAALKVAYTPDAERSLRNATDIQDIIVTVPNNRVKHCSASLDSKKIVCTDGNDIMVWDATTGKNKYSLKGHRATINYVVFGRNDNTILSASNDKTIRIWDTKNQKCTDTLIGHTSAVKTATFNKDNTQIVSSSTDKTARIWNVKTKKCEIILSGHTEWLTSANFSYNGKHIVTSSWDKSIRIWDSENGVCIDTLLGHSKPVLYATFSPDGKLIASTSYDNTIRLWDAATGQCIDTIYWKPNARMVNFDKTSKYIIAPSGTLIHVWKIENNNTQIENTFIGHTSAVNSAFFLNDKLDIISASDDHSIRIHRWNKSCNVHNLYGQLGCTNVSFSPSGKCILAASTSGKICLWNANTYKIIDSISIEDEGFIHCDFFTDSVFYTASRRTLRFWNAYPLKVSTTHNAIIEDFVDIHPNRLYIISRDWYKNNIISVFDLANNNYCQPLIGHDKRVNDAAFSPNGETIASVSTDKTIRLWDFKKKKCIRIIQTPHELYRIKFSNNGKYIVVSNIGINYINSIFVYDISSSKCIQQFKGHTNGIEHVEFSPNDKYIISTSDDKTVRVWDVKTGYCISVFHGHLSDVRNAQFNDNEDKIVSGDFMGGVKVWDFPRLKDIIQQSLERFKNNPLTPEERLEYYLD